jgi:hypothetical protein
MNVCEHVANDFLSMSTGELDAFAEIEGVVERGWGGVCKGDESQLTVTILC